MPSCLKGKNLGAAGRTGEVKKAVPLGTWEKPGFSRNSFLWQCGMKGRKERGCNQTHTAALWLLYQLSRACMPLTLSCSCISFTHIVAVTSEATRFCYPAFSLLSCEGWLVAVGSEACDIQYCLCGFQISKSLMILILRYILIVIYDFHRPRGVKELRKKTWLLLFSKDQWHNDVVISASLRIAQPFLALLCLTWESRVPETQQGWKPLYARSFQVLVSQTQRMKFMNQLGRVLRKRKYLLSGVKEWKAELLASRRRLQY